MVTAIPLMAAVFANLAAGLASNRMRRMLGLDDVKLKSHLVVFGYNPVVASMLGELASRQEVLLVADIDPASVPTRVQLMAGDPTQSEVVERARPQSASRALLAGDSDAQVLMTAVLVKHFAPELPQTAMVQSPKVAAALADLGVNHCIATDHLIGHTLAKSLETPHAGDLLLGIIANDRYTLQERPVQAAWVGRKFSDVRRSYDGVMLGLLHQASVVLGVEHDPVVEADDRVFVLESTP
jgi:voltage-gated potassium channel